MRVFLMAAWQQALKYPAGGCVLSQAGRVRVVASGAGGRRAIVRAVGGAASWRRAMRRRRM